MKDSNTYKIPQREEDLKIWLESFISQESTSSLIYSLDENESQYLLESSRIVINNIIRKKIGMDIDYVSAEMIKKETLHKIENLLQRKCE
ncbi:MAG: hypothetical protein ACK4ND_19145 [Cytophagaceae bacterium]